jgi:hypothetical protein
MRTEGSPTASVSMLPTDRLMEIVQMFHVMERALTEIATAWETDPERGWEIVRGRAVPNGCACCHSGFEEGCAADCPGLLARVALGVA